MEDEMAAVEVAMEEDIRHAVRSVANLDTEHKNAAKDLIGIFTVGKIPHQVLNRIHKHTI